MIEAEVRRSVAAVILAAGGGTRFAGPTHKLLAPLRGRPVISWVFDAVLEASFDRVFVVSGAVELGDIVPAGFEVIPSPQWAEGQAHTLQAAVAAATEAEVEAMVVGLGDQPMVPASAWRSVGAAAGPIVTAAFDGADRPPVKLHRSVWAELPQDGDAGARPLIKARPDLVSRIPCRGNPADIDTIEDLSLWS